ncbi:MAG TPA: hypothetical protein VMY06_06075 [Sedimentisphaerales bacterium]|nr:hypothetical protein [Sedimentisphaerales bacterium]
MNALFTAIYTRWTATMGGRVLYNTVAPGETAFPFNTMTLISDMADWTFTEDFEDCLIQFSLFSDSETCEEIGLTFAALKAAFDKHDLAITGYETISLERLQANLLHVEGKWQYIVTYRILIKKN